MKIVSYLRVSTARQGRSGLGLEAQRAAIDTYAAAHGAQELASFVEVESGQVNSRPELLKALHRAKVTGATLVIAKLDRLSRNAAFLLTLRDSGARFIAADMPDACDLTVGILALVAQRERDAISTRTREALQAAKARGRRLGNPNGAAALQRAGKGNTAALSAIATKADSHATALLPILQHIDQQAQAESRPATLGLLSDELNRASIQTPRGTGRWHRSSVRNLMSRLNLRIESGRLR